MTYAFPPGGLPDQTVSPESTAVFTDAYAVIPASVQRDIVTSLLPGWVNTRAWVLARPLTGFAETFAQYAVELAPKGGSDTPEPNAQAQAVLFVATGRARLTLDGQGYDLVAGSYAYIPPAAKWTLWNTGDTPCGLHWVRKRYVPVDGLDAPEAFVTDDLRHDMHVNIVTFQPGGRIPFAETHVMEHGLYVIQGTADYLLNRDWVPVEAGDFMWLRAFCPQACIATGQEPFRYLLYKDVNRHMPLSL